MSSELSTAKEYRYIINKFFLSHEALDVSVFDATNLIDHGAVMPLQVRGNESPSLSLYLAAIAQHCHNNKYSMETPIITLLRKC